MYLNVFPINWNLNETTRYPLLTKIIKVGSQMSSYRITQKKTIQMRTPHFLKTVKECFFYSLFESYSNFVIQPYTCLIELDVEDSCIASQQFPLSDCLLFISLSFKVTKKTNTRITNGWILYLSCYSDCILRRMQINDRLTTLLSVTCCIAGRYLTTGRGWLILHNNPEGIALLNWASCYKRLVFGLGSLWCGVYYTYSVINTCLYCVRLHFIWII